MASITLSQAEKAFEFDRAKELLARSGRSAGLAYELTKLVEAADRRRGRFDEAATLQAKLLPPTPRLQLLPPTPRLQLLPPTPRLQPGDRVEAKCGPHLGRCGTVSRVYNKSAQVVVQFDLLVTQQVYHEGNLRRLPAKPPAPTFSPGHTVALRSNGRRGLVTAVDRQCDVLVVAYDDGGCGFRRPSKDYRHDSSLRPFRVGDRDKYYRDGSLGTITAIDRDKITTRFDCYRRRPLVYCTYELRHAE